MTLTGKALAKMGRRAPNWAWKAASARFARGARGEVDVVRARHLRPNNFYETVERPVLERNGVSINETFLIR
jgi:hypothetical protein